MHVTTDTRQTREIEGFMIFPALWIRALPARYGTMERKANTCVFADRSGRERRGHLQESFLNEPWMAEQSLDGVDADSHLEEGDAHVGDSIVETSNQFLDNSIKRNLK